MMERGLVIVGLLSYALIAQADEAGGYVYHRKLESCER